jgi:DNA-binding XRE family transcriptional regulator
LDNFDRGCVTYIEDEEYSPNLKVAYQDSYIYLPLIRR